MKLRVLLKLIEDGGWQAICLERCILAQAPTKADVITAFAGLLAAEVAYGIRHGDPTCPLAGIPPAPLPVWDEAERAVPSDEPPTQLMVTLDAAGQEHQIDMPETYLLDEAA